MVAEVGRTCIGIGKSIKNLKEAAKEERPVNFDRQLVARVRHIWVIQTWTRDEKVKDGDASRWRGCLVTKPFFVGFCEAMAELVSCYEAAATLPSILAGGG